MIYLTRITEHFRLPVPVLVFDLQGKSFSTSEELRVTPHYCHR